MTITLRMFGREFISFSTDPPTSSQYEDRTGTFLGFRNDVD